MVQNSFKDRLRLAMKGESNHSFAKLCSVSEGSLRNYLKGQTTPDLDTLTKIAEASGYSLAWLASGEGEMKRGEGEKGSGRAVTDYQQEADALSHTRKTFVDRLNNEIKDHSSIEKLSTESGITIDRINELLSGADAPTEIDIQLIAKALAVNPQWLAEGDSVFNLDKTGLDQDLLKNILGAIEIVADDLGRDENILSVADRIMITIKLYNTFFNRGIRPYVTIYNMIENVMDTYFLRISHDKIDNLKNKIHKENTSNVPLDLIDYFVSMRKHIEEMCKDEGEDSRKEGEEKLPGREDQAPGRVGAETDK